MPPELNAESPLGWVVLFIAGAIASGMNSIAGGGSLVSFPLMVWLGVPALAANATNSVALWPGSVAGAIALRDELRTMRSAIARLFVPTLVGSMLGAYMLVHTTERAFAVVVPLLLGIATTVLLLQPAIRAWMTKRDHRGSWWVGMLSQLVVSAYGGYFGAGMGILMLAAFALYVEGTLQELNATKVWLSLVINLVASAYFVAMGLVRLGPGLAVASGAIIGGYAAARLSKRLPPEWIRRAAIALGLVMTTRFAWLAFATN